MREEIDLLRGEAKRVKQALKWSDCFNHKHMVDIIIEIWNFYRGHFSIFYSYSRSKFLVLVKISDNNVFVWAKIEEYSGWTSFS